MDENTLNNLIKMLREEIKKQRIQIVDNPKLMNSLKKVRYNSEGKVIPSSVDSRVRALAIGITGEKNYEKLLSIPLKESQEKYFELLRQYFSRPFEEMKKYNVLPSQVASDMASRPNIVKAFKSDSKTFTEEIKEFWKYYSPIVNAHIDNLKGLKTNFGGDLFPSESRNIARTVGLYSDTIILPDPLLRVSALFEYTPPEKAFYYLVKHALNVLQYKELDLAEINPPILIITPDNFQLYPENTEMVRETSKSYTLDHLNILLGTDLSSEKEMDGFLKQIKSVNSLKHLMKNPDRLLFDIDQKQEPLEVQIENWMEKTGTGINFLKNKSIGELLKFQVYSRMMQANDTVLRGIQFGATPVIDAPTSWQYLIWKYEHDLKRRGSNEKKIKDLLVNNALTSINSPLIGNLTDKAIIKLRQENALQDLRNLITKNINEVKEASEEDFEKVTNQVTLNLTEAFEEHGKYIEDIRVRNKKFYGYDIIPSLITGGLSIAAAFTGNPVINKVAASFSPIFGSSLFSILYKGIPLVKKNRQIEKTSVGILIKYSK